MADKTWPRTPVVDFTAALDTSTLKGKSVLVTGGASGIGLACVEAFAKHGAVVTVVDLQEEAGQAIAKELTSMGHKVQFVQCDVTSYEAQAKAFKSAVQFGGGKLDIAFPNAGVLAQKNLFEMVAHTVPSLDSHPPEPGFSSVDVNLRGVYYSCYLALHYFRLPAPSASIPFKKSIVLLASVVGYMGYAPSTTYSMSKFGVRGIFHSIRAHGFEQDLQVRINLVAPWYVKTPMTTDLTATANIFGFAPMEGVVDAVLRLAGNEEIASRAVAIFPEGNFDVGDDIWGDFAGPKFTEMIGKRMEAISKAMEAIGEATA
ncbi:NAD(P)-binding protein [Lindgomyces ingoldianus]|uniref:NAD(P)-binding protein n=1 Tax=Lindgomyces ingoldianus TaxID=673940 RepID=A0ACB6QFP2_9PLEO|nr:NAD(P)-binding protein [Lindgomyces ingoldianus]KAF2465690.1 NAD(P)-binding protein [Lindgomyces ingoldianus]